MFKQFEGFKDFTMNTAKSGLSAGEKSAFWFVNKLKILSKRWFTHLFLTLCLVLYSIMGAAMFYALEGKTFINFFLRTDVFFGIFFENYLKLLETSIYILYAHSAFLT